MRHGVFFRANWVLNNWYDTFEMNLDNDMDGGFTQIVGLAVVGGYIKLLSRYWFFESQRASIAPMPSPRGCRGTRRTSRHWKCSRGMTWRDGRL